MGREIKRVPLDFDWPLNEVWRGFINPHYKVSRDCAQCGGSGYSKGAKYLYDQWYGYEHFEPSMTGSKAFTPFDAPVVAFAARNVVNDSQFYLMYHHAIYEASAIHREATRLCGLWNKAWSHHLDDDDVAALVKSNRLADLTHQWTPEKGWQRREPFIMPTAAQVNEWSLQGFGHDSINARVCVRAKAKRLGIPHTCSNCRGHGSLWVSKNGRIRFKSRYQKRRSMIAEAWKEIEPPKGSGWQLWETVSEGSPISPVFATADAFEDYLVSEGYSRKAARSFMGVGWAPSMLCVGGILKRDIQSCEEIA